MKIFNNNKMEQDPYKLFYDPLPSSLMFRDRNIFVPFDCSKIVDLLTKFRAKLEDKNICIADIDMLPYRIFANTPLSYNPYFAKWIYAIVETWVSEVENTFHMGQKQRLFNGFLSECKELAKASDRTELKVLTGWIEKDDFHKEYFEQEFIKVLLALGFQITNNPILISNFINGLALLPEYLKTSDIEVSTNFDKLTQPVFDLMLNDIKRAIKIDPFLSDEFICKGDFYRSGVHFPLSKQDLLEHINSIKSTLLTKNENNQIINEWVQFKHKVFNDSQNFNILSGIETELQLSVKQIALIYFYEGKQITRINASEIASQYKFINKTSGEGLFQDYTHFCSPSNRKGKPNPCTPKKIKNRIKLLESTIKFLSEKAKLRAIDEVKILNTIFENEFD